MQAFFGSDGSWVVQFLVIFLIILALMIGVVLLFRRFSGRGMSLTSGANGRGRQPRLGIVDIYELDRQRQLILLRRDNVEHLLLVGGPNDVVIERHIQRGAGARYAPEPDHAADPALDSAQESRRTEKFLDSPAPPAFAMPEVVPPAMPGAEAPHPERAPPLDPGLFEPEVVAPSSASPSAPARARPASPVSRLIRRTAPLADTPPEPAPAPPPASEPVPETPPVIAGRGPRPVDPAVLSDMARQLQVALQRPSSAVTPPPGGPESPPLPPAPDLRPDPLAAAMASAQAEPPPVPKAPAPAKTAPAKPAPKPAAEAKPAPEPKIEAAAKSIPAKSIPAMTAPADPAPVTVPAPPGPAPAQPPKPAPAKPAETAAPKPESKPAPEAKPIPPPAPPKPEAQKPEAPATEATAQNPFSVEEIEAEFARLLGRPLDNNKG